MIDVHPPEHGIHGGRDFFLHLFTITIGLLIALGLEASVEAVHHRHQRQEAEATIRQELRENQKALVKMQRDTSIEIDNQKKALNLLEDLREGKKDNMSGINLSFNVNPLPDAAWRTANVTGALSYMDYDEAQRFAVAYSVQAVYENAVATGFSEFELLGTYETDGHDLQAMSQQDTTTAIPDFRRTLADLRAMSDIGRGTLSAYVDALK